MLIIILATAVCLLAAAVVGLVVLTHRQAMNVKFFEDDIEHQRELHQDATHRNREFFDALVTASTTKIDELEVQVSTLEQELANSHVSLELVLEEDIRHA